MVVVIAGLSDIEHQVHWHSSSCFVLPVSYSPQRCRPVSPHPAFLPCFRQTPSDSGERASIFHDIFDTHDSSISSIIIQVSPDYAGKKNYSVQPSFDCCFLDKNAKIRHLKRSRDSSVFPEQDPQKMNMEKIQIGPHHNHGDLVDRDQAKRKSQSRGLGVGQSK